MQSDSLTRTQRARRADIVQAAVTVLDRRGYGVASVEGIAAEAGTSKGTVLYHFGTKDGVHEAVVSELYRLGADYMTERVRAVEGARGKLFAYLRSNLAFIVEHAAHVRAVHRILENSPIRIDGAEALPPLTRLLAAGQATGELGTFDPAVVALAIRSVVDGAAFHFTAHPELHLDHYIEEMVRLFDRATAPESLQGE